VPEYLAPGVYVEETSFRAKSIEGVSTSTTGFVGPTRKGPIEGTPELITSFGDFERVYGGFADLSLGPNYLAHAVRAYFDNGGSRLYVARVYAAGTGTGNAASAWTGDGGDDKNKVRFVARYPGQAGNGQVAVKLVKTLATGRGMAAAPEGSVLRIKKVEPGPARLTGGKPPFSLQNNTTLKLAGLTGITFLGRPAEVTGTKTLDNTVTISANSHLKVDFGQGPQTIPLPAGPIADAAAAAALAELVDQALVGGSAGLVGGKLVIRSEVRGIDSRVRILEDNPDLGFTAGETKNVRDANNTVGDLFRVTAGDVQALLQAANADAVSAGLSPGGNLLLATKATGDAATLQVEDAGSSARAALGLGTGQEKGTAELSDAAFVKTGGAWKRDGGQDLDVSGLDPAASPGQEAYFITANVLTVDADGEQKSFEGLGLALGHPRWIGSVLGTTPSRRIDALENLFALELGESVKPLRLLAILTPPGSGDLPPFALTGGDDGGAPSGADYGNALDALSRIEDISIVAAPGHSAYAEFQAIQGQLIEHVERRRAYRVAVLDTPPDQTLGDAQQTRSRVDSTRAALYYPWVVTDNPLAGPKDETVPREILVPPSGFVCGIYARNDVERSVAKAPANEVVRGALRFETDINFAEQEVLNPAGINCLRFFPGRSYRVWGARTASSDPEWKYVNVRRYFLYLEHSIDRGTQWAVFENNGERLWANVRETIESFLYNEWRSGNLLGGSPAEAYFVRCDRSTMTQNDLDNGRLICLIGVAVLKPAEFVIFRIGQKTADART
jgi:hypothetical protein